MDLKQGSRIFRCHLWNVKISFPILIQLFDKVCGQKGRCLFYILMNKKVDILKTFLFPFCQMFQPVTQSFIITFRIGSYIADKGIGGGKAHMKHVSSSGSIYNNVGDIVGFKKFTGCIEDFFICKPFRISELYRQRFAAGWRKGHSENEDSDVTN